MPVNRSSLSAAAAAAAATVTASLSEAATEYALTESSFRQLYGQHPWSRSRQVVAQRARRPGQLGQGPRTPSRPGAARHFWNIFPPFGTCLVIGIQRAGRRCSPTATGSGRGRMARRPSRSHPPDFQGGQDAHEHGSCHVRHHPLMGTADVNRCGSVPRSLMCDH
jgi:hypothetical protein